MNLPKAKSNKSANPLPILRKSKDPTRKNGEKKNAQ